MKKKKLSKKITLSKETISRLSIFDKDQIKGGKAGNDETRPFCDTVGACETDGQNYCFPIDTYDTVCD